MRKGGREGWQVGGWGLGRAKRVTQQASFFMRVPYLHVDTLERLLHELAHGVALIGRQHKVIRLVTLQRCVRPTSENR